MLANHASAKAARADPAPNRGSTGSAIRGGGSLLAGISTLSGAARLGDSGGNSGGGTSIAGGSDTVAAASGAQSVPQRAQRTTPPGVSRASGTS